MRLSENLSSETSRVGDTVSFEVLADIQVGGLIVIKRGSPAIATVTEAQAKRRMGKGGKLDVSIDFVRQVTGEKVALRAVKENQGGSKTGRMTTGIVVTSIVFFPAAPFFLFMKGKDVTIPKGTEIISYVHSDVRLDEAKLRAAAVNASVAPRAVQAAQAPEPVQVQPVSTPAVQPAVVPKPSVTPAPKVPAPAAPSIAAPAAAPKAIRGGLTNADLIELKRAGFSDDLIISKIRGSACAFKLDSASLSELRRAGFTDKVFAAMAAKMK
jgi:hypothetical protein